MNMSTDQLQQSVQRRLVVSYTLANKRTLSTENAQSQSNKTLSTTRLGRTFTFCTGNGSSTKLRVVSKPSSSTDTVLSHSESVQYRNTLNGQWRQLLTNIGGRLKPAPSEAWEAHSAGVPRGWVWGGAQ